MKRHQMAKRLLSGLLLTGILAGCGGTASSPASEAVGPWAPDISQTDGFSQAAAGDRTETGESANDEKERNIQVAAEPVMDAAFHRGTITETGLVGTVTTYTLTGAPGSGYGELTVTFDATTRMDFDPDQLQVGDQVEVYYSGLSCALEEEVPYVAAISAALLLPEASTNYNGVVAEIRPGENSNEGSLVMRPLDGQETEESHQELLEEFIFYYTPDTLWRLGLSPEEVRPGDTLNIYHRGVATMSIPPQGGALEIRRMAEPEGETTGEQPASAEKAEESLS